MLNLSSSMLCLIRPQRVALIALPVYIHLHAARRKRPERDESLRHVLPRLTTFTSVHTSPLEERRARTAKRRTGCWTHCVCLKCKHQLYIVIICPCCVYGWLRCLLVDELINEDLNIFFWPLGGSRASSKDNTRHIKC